MLATANRFMDDVTFLQCGADAFCNQGNSVASSQLLNAQVPMLSAMQVAEYI